MKSKIFVSYKSEDAVAVRIVAELLRADGFKMWFAEYEIAVEARPAFQRRIETAIDASDYGLCFTNDLYARSEYCGLEIRRLLARLPPERILEVAFPRGQGTHMKYNNMSEVPWVEVPVRTSGTASVIPSSADIRRIMDFIYQHLNATRELPRYEDPVEHNRLAYCTRGIHYSLDCGGWKPKAPSLIARIMARRSCGPAFAKDTQSGLLTGHLLVGPQDVARKSFGMGQASDREYYEEALRFGSSFYRNIQKQRCIGTHLFFVEGVSHTAFTTCDHATGLFWRRLYSIVLPMKVDRNVDAEFAFFFGFFGDFHSFLREAYRMDQLVLSFRLEKDVPI